MKTESGGRNRAFQNVGISDVAGEVPDEFDLDIWVAQSFGIWRDAQEDIILRALPHCADRARQWRFHPHQQLQQEEDGSIIIKFVRQGCRN